ncbi:MFS transporter, partial [Saccharopolyspora tripterygii]
IAGTATLLAIACAIGLHEPERDTPNNVDTSAKNDRKRPSVMQVPGAALLAVAAIGAYFGVYGLIPVYAEQVERVVADHAAASLWVGVLHAVMWGATLIGSFWWGKHNDLTQRPMRTFAVAAGGCAASIAIVALPLDPFGMIPFRLVQGFSFAALAQSLFLHFSKHAPGTQKSSFVSTANSYLLVGQSVGPLLAGPMVGIMPVPSVILVMATACALGFFLALGPARAEKHRLAEDDVHGDDHQDGDQPGTETTAPFPALRTPRNGVGVVPFRGWRITTRHLDSLASQYATLSGKNSGTPAGLDHTFRAWQRSGAVIQDRRPAFYVYEQSGPHGSVRGILAAVHLDSGLLPHEDVIPERVDSLIEVLQGGQVNPEPVLLGFSGDGRTTKRIADATQEAPVTEVLANDGQSHRLWRITDYADQDEIIDELDARAAYIADGHHRHAATRQLRRSIYAEGHGPGPWDFLPGLLVDVKASPLRLAPIHRVLPFADPQLALKASRTRFRVQPLRGELPHWATVLKHHARRGPAFVLATPQGGFLVSDPEPGFLDAAMRDTQPAIRNMHVAVLHTALIDQLWQIHDSPEDIRYEQNAVEAVRQVRRNGGVAVLTNPPAQEDLVKAAAAGVRLPRKSTSFGPKPHPGLIFRTLEEPVSQFRKLT